MGGREITMFYRNSLDACQLTECPLDPYSYQVAISICEPPQLTPQLT